MFRAKDRASWVEPNDLFPNTDWCLLLPDPDPDPSAMVVMGDGPSAACARRRFGALENRGQASLVVGGGFDPATVRSLRSRLGPGGVAYLEADMTSGRVLSRARRALLDNGFDDVAFYASSPASHRWEPSWWVPIGSSAAVRFVAAARTHRRFGAGASLRSRVVRLAYRAAGAVPGALRSRPWLLHPRRPAVLCAVAVVADASGRTDPTPAIARLAADESETPVRASVRPAVLVRAGGSSTDQPMAFVFAAGSATPTVLVKAPSRTEEIAASGHEAEMLASLAQCAQPVPGIPHLLGALDGRDIAIFAQSFIAGVPVAATVRPRTVGSVAEAMTAWTISLAEATAVPVDATWAPGVLAAALDETRATIGDDLATRLRAVLAAPLSTVHISVTQHRDLGPWNVHRTGDGAVGVIDWADAVAAGVPLADLVHHLMHLELCASDAYEPGARDAAISRWMADGPASVVGRCIERYVGATGLAADAIPALRVLTWLIDLGRQAPEDRAGSMYLTLLREELRVSQPALGWC